MTDTRELVDELRHNAKCHFDGYPLARRVTGEQLSKAADTITALSERCSALEEALTPSGETKYAYIGEFSWTEWVPDENGIEQGHVRAVPWTTIKDIMAGIRARAALTSGGRG